MRAICGQCRFMLVILERWLRHPFWEPHVSVYLGFISHFISKIKIIWLCESADLLAFLYIEWITRCIKHWTWKCSHCSQKDEWITNSNKTNNKKQRDETRFSSRWAVMKPSWLFCGQKNWIYVHLTVIKDNTFIKTQSETVFLLWGLLYFPYIMGNLSQSSIHEIYINFKQRANKQNKTILVVLRLSDRIGTSFHRLVQTVQPYYRKRANGLHFKTASTSKIMKQHIQLICLQ